MGSLLHCGGPSGDQRTCGDGSGGAGRDGGSLGRAEGGGVAALLSSSDNINERLFELARVSEMCALKKLELCQQELVQVQTMWDMDREARRLTIATLQQEVAELRHQLKHQRHFGVAQHTHGARTTLSSPSSSQSPLISPGASYLLPGGSGGRANIPAPDDCTKSDAGVSCDGSLPAYVAALEDSVERYRRLLCDADKEREKLRDELSRAARQNHDIRCVLTQRILSLLCEKESMAHEHAMALEQLEETTGLLAAARVAERAAVRQLAGSCQDEPPVQQTAAATSGADAFPIRCLRRALSPVATGGSAFLCDSTSLRSTLMEEEEMCGVELGAGCASRCAESLRRVFLPIIDEVDDQARDCRAATEEALLCLREMSLLLSAEEEECDSDGSSDRCNADDITSLPQSHNSGETRDSSALKGCAAPPLTSSSFFSQGDSNEGVDAHPARLNLVAVSSGKICAHETGERGENNESVRFNA